ELTRHRGGRLPAVSLHVGLNVLHLVPGETGGGETYVRQLVPALLEAREDLRLTLFAGDEAYPVLSAECSAAVVRLPVQARSRVRRVAAEQSLLPWAVRRAGVDLLHNTLNTPPAELRQSFDLGDAPVVLTVAAKRPHKNLGRLIEAVGRLETEAMLVVPGFETQFEAKLEREAGRRVRFLGWVDDRTLDGLYRA